MSILSQETCYLMHQTFLPYPLSTCRFLKCSKLSANSICLKSVLLFCTATAVCPVWPVVSFPLVPLVCSASVSLWTLWTWLGLSGDPKAEQPSLGLCLVDWSPLCLCSLCSCADALWLLWFGRECMYKSKSLDLRVWSYKSKGIYLGPVSGIESSCGR